MAYNLQEMRAMKPRIDEYFNTCENVVKADSFVDLARISDDGMGSLAAGLAPSKRQISEGMDAAGLAQIDKKLLDSFPFNNQHEAQLFGVTVDEANSFVWTGFVSSCMLELNKTIMSFKGESEESSDDGIEPMPVIAAKLLAIWGNERWFIPWEINLAQKAVAEAQTDFDTTKRNIAEIEADDKRMVDSYGLASCSHLIPDDPNPAQSLEFYKTFSSFKSVFHYLASLFIPFVISIFVFQIIFGDIMHLPGLTFLPIPLYIAGVALCTADDKKKFNDIKGRIKAFIPELKKEHKKELIQKEIAVENAQTELANKQNELKKQHDGRVAFQSANGLIDLTPSQLIDLVRTALGELRAGSEDMLNALSDLSQARRQAIIDSGLPVGERYWSSFDQLIDYIADGRATDSAQAIQMLIDDQRYAAEQAERQAHEQRMYEAQKAAADAQMHAEAERTRMTKEHLQREKAANEAMRAHVEASAAAQAESAARQAAAAERQAYAAEASAEAAAARAAAAEKNAKQNAEFQQRMEEQQKAQTDAAYAAAAYSEFSAKANAAMADKRRADHPDNYYHNQGTDWQRDFYRHR